MPDTTKPNPRPSPPPDVAFAISTLVGMKPEQQREVLEWLTERLPKDTAAGLASFDECFPPCPRPPTP